MDDPKELSQPTKNQHNVLFEDGTLKYDFMICLQKIAMARIVSNLWINQNTQRKIVYFYRRRKMMMWSAFTKVEDNILAKVSQLLLPNSICQELKDLVRIFQSFIVKWMNYHDQLIFNSDRFEYSAVDLLHNIMWTARGKIDYLQTAKNILVKSDTFLSNYQKYLLVCTYCLEDKIYLLSSEFVDKFFLSRIKIDRQPMLCFWTAQMTGDMSQLNNPQYYMSCNRRRDSMSINEHIMWLLIKSYGEISDKTANDIPIRFMWSKLNKEEKIKSIPLFKNVENPDFIISFLSNLDYDLQQKVLKECFLKLLYAILDEWWWWGDSFLTTALYVLDIMDALSFWKVLRLLNMKKNKTDEKNTYDNFKSLFKLLWQKGSTQSKEFIFQDEARPLDEFVIYELDWEKDEDVIEVIFKDLNTQQKKNIVLGEYGMDQCAYYIQYDKWNSLDLFIKYTLSKDEDIIQLKQKFMEVRGRRLAMFFFRNSEFHKMEHFLNWAFNSAQEISNFRQSLNYTVPPLIQ